MESKSAKGYKFGDQVWGVVLKFVGGEIVNPRSVDISFLAKKGFILEIPTGDKNDYDIIWEDKCKSSLPGDRIYQSKEDAVNDIGQLLNAFGDSIDKCRLEMLDGLKKES